MFFRVLFRLHKNVRRTGILTGYRPTWTGDSKPDHNSGALEIFGDKETIELGETHENCLLHPVAPEFWKDIQNGDILKCMEGSREVGDAVVMYTFEDDKEVKDKINGNAK